MPKSSSFLRALCLPTLTLALAAQGACSSDPPAAAGPVARFELSSGKVPDLFGVPWPSDAYLKDGHIVDPIPGFDAIVTDNGEYIENELGKLDGFSRISHAFFLIDDPDAPRDDLGQIAGAVIDRASLPHDEDACIADTSSVFLVDLEATDPAAARVRCRSAVQDDRPWGSDKHPVLAVGPARGIVLREGHKYAAVMTNRVRDASGRAVAPSAAFSALASASADPTATLYRDALAKARLLLGPALTGTSIVAIAPYTTHTRAREILQLRETLEAEPIPKLSFDTTALAPMGDARFAKPVASVLPAGFTASLDAWLGLVDPKDKLPDGSDDPDNQLLVRAHDHIAAYGTAVFEASNYLQDKAGGYEELDDATFARDAGGKIVRSPTRPTQKIWVSIVVPDAPMPTDGYPLVIVQHGLGASREYLVQNANLFATRGWMVVAIDSLTFGARAPEPEFQTDTHSDYEAAPGATYVGPDGISDAVNGSRSGPTDLFGGLKNLGAFRDQLRQASIDTAQLVRVLRSDPDLGPLQTGADKPRIDPARVVYVGESLGSIEGEVAAAVVPDVKHWVFSVGGGGFIMEAATHGPGIGSLLNAGAGLLFHFLRDHLTEFHPLVNLVQTVIEPADPLIYAEHLIADPWPVAGKPSAGRDVLLLESIDDELVANEAGEAFARATGLVLAEPNVGSNAGTVDLKTPISGYGRVPLKSVGPDGTGTIHDVPQVGITGVVVQAGPCDHGSDWVSSKGTHGYAIPFTRYDSAEPFVRLDAEFPMRNPYRELGAQICDFAADSFAGKVPGVIVKKAPVRDYDDDGVADDVDADPSNPAVK